MPFSIPPLLPDDTFGVLPDGPRSRSLPSPPPALLVRQTYPELLRQAAVDWACILCLWALMWFVPWTAVLAMPLVGGRLYALGVLMHDASHQRRVRRGGWGTLVEIVCAWPIGITTARMAYHHLNHHRETCTQQDPYFYDGMEVSSRRLLALAFMTFTLPIWWVTSILGPLALVVPRLRPFYGTVILSDRSGRDLTHDRLVLQTAREEWPITVLFFGVVIPLCVLFPLQMLLGYVIPVCFTGMFQGIRILWEHLYVRTSSKDPLDVVALTTDVMGGALLRATIAPHHIGYHVAHHLHPTVAHQHLPRLRRWYQEQLGESYPKPLPWRSRAKTTSTMTSTPGPAS